METKTRIEAIVNAKQEQGLTVQQLSDMCGISASTVSRTLAGKTAPTEYTLNALEEAMGISEGTEERKLLEAVSSDPMMESYLRLQESRVARLRAHYNMLLAEKNRWIKMLFLLVLVLVVFICGLLMYDVLHPDIGWIRDHLGAWFDMDDIFSNICLNVLCI